MNEKRLPPLVLVNHLYVATAVLTTNPVATVAMAMVVAVSFDGSWKYEYCCCSFCCLDFIV